MSKLKYWWGSDNPLEPKVFVMGLIFGFLVISTTLFVFTDAIQNGRPAIEDAMSFESVSGLLTVSIGWIFVFTSITSGQTMTKMEEDDAMKEVALRSVGNTLEYGLMTLLLIWMHGVYCNATAAAVMGGAYVIARLFYGFLYGFYGEFTLFVEFSTQPGYFAKGYLLLGLIYVLATGHDLSDSLSSWYMPLIALGGWALYMIPFGMMLGVPYLMVFKSGAKWRKRLDEQRALEASVESEGVETIKEPPLAE